MNADVMVTVEAQLAELKMLLVNIHGLLANPTQPREGYPVEEVAATFSKSAYSVREWCRHGRIHATKRTEKRGGAELWNDSAAEVSRIKNEGLLPPDPHRNAAR